MSYGSVDVTRINGRRALAARRRGAAAPRGGGDDCLNAPEFSCFGSRGRMELTLLKISKMLNVKLYAMQKVRGKIYPRDAAKSVGTSEMCCFSQSIRGVDL